VDLIERVGAYFGFACFLGLAILALLYFSQARDVRRLREWAGRAPERAGGELDATQHYLPPTPIEHATRHGRPLRERLRRIHIPQLRYIALVVGGLVIVAGAVVGGLQLTGGGDDTTTPAGTRAQRVKGERNSRSSGGTSQANVDPASVTVAVLNGTTTVGLAARVGEEAKADGFTVGTVTNAARTDQSGSEVLYRQGQKNAAQAVARRLGVRSTRPVDPLSAELAGSFDVVVLVGADRSD
jgi:hypothetical protein